MDMPSLAREALAALAVPSQHARLIQRSMQAGANSPSLNPSRTAATENADRWRKREFSHRFHAYIASSRIADQLGWLWALTYAQLGLQRAGQAIATDAVHVHHVHLSVGTDQP